MLRFALIIILGAISFAASGDARIGVVASNEDHVSVWDEIILRQPTNSVAYYNRGVALQTKERWEKAIADYTEAIKLKRDYAEAYFARGVAFDETGDPERAIADYTEAINIRPNYAEAYCN